MSWQPCPGCGDHYDGARFGACPKCGGRADRPRQDPIRVEGSREPWRIEDVAPRPDVTPTAKPMENRLTPASVLGVLLGAGGGGAAFLMTPGDPGLQALLMVGIMMLSLFGLAKLLGTSPVRPPIGVVAHVAARMMLWMTVLGAALFGGLALALDLLIFLFPMLRGLGGH